eukprot:CAMPEP_0168575090 /NCGR_PEP_ID=MMETSP0413-20121227/19460_1 /TAXON_ID=136452 /ORGANISM="Filamoeba nolandi, Strain NC-AS-23-1" /LENGTH=130 /DNA_ID=CAMNT_0008608539 /DNA_START=625 /DNA_END=1014 /DNA_ORIENTATION=+
MTVVSLRLRKILKEAEGFSQQHKTKGQKQTLYAALLQKLTWYILAMDFVLVLTIISLIIYVIIDAATNRWKYLIIHTLFRIEEVVLVLFTLLFVRRRAESGVSSATTAHSGSDRLSHITISSKVESFGSA